MISSTAAPRAISFGEVVIDEFPGERVVAGSPLHVAVHLAALGWDAYLLTRLGVDEDAAAARAVLEEWGVDTALVQTHSALPTGRVTVDMSGADHGFIIHGPAAWDDIHIPHELPDHDVFCYATLAGRSQRSLASLLHLLPRVAAFKALDVNLRPPEPFVNALTGGLGHATLVKMGVDELPVVAERIGVDPAPGSFLEAFPHLEWFSLSKGAHGAELHSRRGEVWSSPGRHVDVVDSVGAGDAFFAGLVDALYRGLDGGDALEAAQQNAAATIGRRGGLPARNALP